MKFTPLRLALPLLSCALLAGCRNSPPVISVPSDPAVLNGTWQGDLTAATGTWEAALGDGRVYLLQQESVPGFVRPEPDSPPRLRRGLLVLDAATGTELRQLSLPSVLSLRFRPADDGVPARLLVLRTAPPSGTGTGGVVLAELDPVTLEELKQTPLPTRSDPYRLGADGRWLLSGWDVPLDTRTLQPAALPQAVEAELQLPQDTPTRRASWAFGERFLRVSTRSSAAQTAPWSSRYFSVASGQAFGGPAQHPAACSNISVFQLEDPADMVSLPDGGAALAYRDGTVELRDASDRLREVVNLGGCQPVTLRVDGDVLTFAEPSSRELGTLRVSDGQVLGRRTVATLELGRPPLLVAEGTALTFSSSDSLAALERVSGQAWQLTGQTHHLRLETRATWQSKTAYSSMGTALLDGERLNFAAVADSGGYELRPQGNLVMPVTWQGELRRADGTLVARIGGSHMNQTPYQNVQLELQGGERDFAFRGSLKP